jgi:hypothetical protein
VLWTARDGPGALLADLLLDGSVSGAGVYVGRVRWLRDISVELVRRYQFTLALIPGLEHLGRGSASQDAGVDQTCKFYMWDVS